MVILTQPRLDYQPTSRAVFPHGNLLDELRSIRRRLSTPTSQLIHILSVVFFYVFLASTIILVFALFDLPLVPSLFLLILFLLVPCLGFFWYLDPAICIFWAPCLVAIVVGSVFIAEVLEDIVPTYAAIPISFGLAWVALLPQLIAALLLDKESRWQALDVIQLMVMNPFFLGYCGIGWLTFWHARRETIDKIWGEEEGDPKRPGEGDVKDLER